MVDEVSSVSQQTAAEATSVSAASEEQAASLSEASTNIQQLSQLAEELNDNVDDFDAGGAQSHPSAAAPSPEPSVGQHDPEPESDVRQIEPEAELSAPTADGGVETDADIDGAMEENR